jgi:sulfur carrier protein ThiS
VSKALFRFYEELNDRLPTYMRKRDVEVPLEGEETAREIIEKLGVSPAEVDLLLVNGQTVDLDHGVGDGDRVSVYPVFERLNIKGVSRVRENPLRTLRFIVDRKLSALARSLAELGLDVCNRGNLNEAQVRKLAKEERRILLTEGEDSADLQGLERRIVLKPASIQEQIAQIMEALDLAENTLQERQDEGEGQTPCSEK